MRCLACNEELTDQEATRKFPSGEFIDLCDPCIAPIRDQIIIIESMDAESEDAD